MSLRPCQKDGEKGWKFGENGTCYTGPGAKAKAEQEKRAIVNRMSKRFVKPLNEYDDWPNSPEYIRDLEKELRAKSHLEYMIDYQGFDPTKKQESCLEAVALILLIGSLVLLCVWAVQV
jgi:hypothetical protein